MIDTSIGINDSSTDLRFLNWEINDSGFLVNPIQLPSTNTFVILGISSALQSLYKGEKSNSSGFFTMINFNKDSLSFGYKSLDTVVIRDKFFTIPIFYPSGVSAGQMKP